jgi:hypothetical protein
MAAGFAPSTSVSAAQHSTDCFTLIIIRGGYKRPVVGSVIVDSVPLHTKKETKTEMQYVFVEADAEFLNVISSNKFMVTKSGYVLN